MSIRILGKSQIQSQLPSLIFSEGGLSAGFPSSADDYLERALDLHELLVEHPTATFFVKVEGNSMMDAHIYSGDILIVDRAMEAQDGKIIVAHLNGEFTVKRLRKKGGKLFLLAENARYPSIEITEDSEFQVWGVVTYVIHRSR